MTAAEDHGVSGLRAHIALAQVHATLALTAARVTTLIIAADAESAYGVPGTGTAQQVTAWKQATR